jgi:large subunit ribosomal protein L24
MNKIRKGDEVVVIAGRDKGRRGTVVKILPGQVVVEVRPVSAIKM